MKTIAIIAEFNPAHNGHKYLIDSIRRHFQEEVTILVLLSGDFVQRGEPAMFDSYTRAKMAMNIGADLVLELPLPYSYQTAQIYAKTNIHILKELHCVDFLAFGSESGDIEELRQIANQLEKVDIQSLRTNSETKNLSYAKLRENYIKETLGEKFSCLLKEPNNILAIEYLLALKDTNIKPITFQRLGDYHEEKIEKSNLMSATSIRKIIQESKFLDSYMSADEFPSVDIAKIAINNQMAFLDDSAYYKSILYSLSTNFQSDIFDVDDTLSSSILHATYHCVDFPDFIRRISSKNYTVSHAQRAVLNIHFGYKKTDYHMPKFSRLLAANLKGRILLNLISSLSSFPIITKNADYQKYPDIIDDFLYMMKLESFYLLTRQAKVSIDQIYKMTPTILPNS